MNINKPTKIIIGLLTAFEVLFPFLIMPGLMMFLMSGIFIPLLGSSHTPGPNMILRSVMPVMMVFYPAMMCFTIVQLGLQIFYVIHEIKNRTLTDTYRILFVLGTFLLPHITMAIYYIAYLWMNNSSETKPSTIEAEI